MLHLPIYHSGRAIRSCQAIFESLEADATIFVTTIIGVLASGLVVSGADAQEKIEVLSDGP